MSTINKVDTFMTEHVVVPLERLVVGRKANGRRIYSREGKRALIEACLHRPTVSIAATALAHGLNANLLRKWIKRYQMRNQGMARTASTSAPARLLPVALAPAPATSQLRDSQNPTRTALLRVQLYGATVELSGEVDRIALSIVLDCLRTHTSA